MNDQAIKLSEKTEITKRMTYSSRFSRTNLNFLLCVFYGASFLSAKYNTSTSSLGLLFLFYLKSVSPSSSTKSKETLGQRLINIDQINMLNLINKTFLQEDCFHKLTSTSLFLTLINKWSPFPNSRLCKKF